MGKNITPPSTPFARKRSKFDHVEGLQEKVPQADDVKDSPNEEQPKGAASPPVRNDSGSPDIASIIERVKREPKLADKIFKEFSAAEEQERLERESKLFVGNYAVPLSKSTYTFTTSSVVLDVSVLQRLSTRASMYGVTKRNLINYLADKFLSETDGLEFRKGLDSD